jgi:hypothetical protein
MKEIIILFIITISMTACEEDYNYSLNDRYVEAEVANNIQSIRGDFNSKTIPTSDEVTEYLDEKLSSPSSVNCLKKSKSSRIVVSVGEVQDQEILEEEEEEETIVDNQEDSVEAKLKRNFSKMGGTPVAVDQALCFFNKNKNKTFHRKVGGENSGSTSIKNKDYMVIQDFTLRSNQKRLFLLNMKSGEVETMYSALGFGTSGPKSEGQNRENVSNYFSNNPSTYLTPRGFMLTAEKKESSTWGWKWKLPYDGLQKNLNDNSRDRAIIFHKGVKRNDGNSKTITKGISSSSEEKPDLIMRDETGRQTSKYKNPQHYSQGCTTVAVEHADYVYEKIKGRSLSYNFTHHEEKLGSSYCGDQSMVKE